MMLNSPDWGARFYNEHAKPFFSQMISFLTQTSELSLEKLPVKEDNGTRWLAYFHNNYATGEKSFAFSTKRMLHEGGITLNGENADRERQLNAIFQLMTTCCHEFRHYEQSHMQGERSIEKLDPMAILFAKESILLREDNDFYKQYHDSFLIELDATAQAFLEMKGLISSIEHQSKDMARIIRNCDSYHAELSKEMLDYRKRNGFADEISARFDQVIAKMPASKRKMYMDAMPCLTLAYNIDGTKKSYKTIMGIKSSFIQTKKNSTALPSEKAIFISKMDRIFTTIIETDKSLRKQKDDDYQSQQIKKDQFGISYEAIEKERRKIESSKGISQSR